MFLGHFGLAFAARKASPAISLGALFLACQFADLLWPTLVLAGIERVEIEPGATRSRRSTSSAIRTRTAWWP